MNLVIPEMVWSNGDQLARVVGKHLSDLQTSECENKLSKITKLYLEWLGQDPLDLPGSGDLKLVLLRQLIHSQDSDDVLVRVLKDLQDTHGNIVVLVTNNIGVHDPEDKDSKANGNLKD